ncbi:MAG: UDP-N-acetylmuramate dehydrogenase [Candidatus Omnitrophica bacterium]|nr:UDP-N-acetylmuramate dehydrogenase [Candidatus Omnitrophota bacterium]
MPWLKELKGQIHFKEPLNIHTTLGVGGAAGVWVEPRDCQELKKVICHCLNERIPYVVIGKGSNILFSDRGFKGIVVCLNSPQFTKMEVKRNCVSSGAGLSLNTLIRETQKRGLAGLEFLAGIPASIAGALVMNAGNRQKGIGSLAKSVTVMDKQGRVRILKSKQLRFGYRQSNLNRYIVLEAVLKLVKGSPKTIKENITRALTRKRKTQDLSFKSAGCIFRNPRYDLTAGEMIEACGLKGRREGGAEISGKHANYIVNRNGAKAKDILYLIKLAQEEVKKKFDVLLEPEIKIIK